MEFGYVDMRSKRLNPLGITKFGNIGLTVPRAKKFLFEQIDIIIK